MRKGAREGVMSERGHERKQEMHEGKRHERRGSEEEGGEEG